MANTGEQARKKRVRILKKLIIAVFLAAVLLPCAVSIVLGVRLHAAEKEINRLREMNEKLMASEQEASREQGVYSVSEIEDGRGNVIEDSSEADAGTDSTRKVYLTFDDGPSENTDEILDILKENNVKATFFVVGKSLERYRKEYKRIVEEGHTLGMHSYSHKYDEIYASLDNYKADLSKLQEFLYETTGIWSRYCRFPGGSSNTVSHVDMNELIGYLGAQDIMYFDWNVESGDTTSGKISADRLVDNCISRIETLDNAVVLMHDAADKDSTVKALPVLIEKIKKMGNTQILPITDETVPVHHQINKSD